MPQFLGSHCVAEAGLNLTVFPPQPPQSLESQVCCSTLSYSPILPALSTLCAAQKAALMAYLQMDPRAPSTHTPGAPAPPGP